MKILRIVSILCFVSCSLTIAAQTDIDLAEYYYSQGQYEQAKLYYEKLYKTNKTNRIYTNYVNTLVALKDFETAEGLVKKKIKENNKDGFGYLSLGDLYKKFEMSEEAKEQFDEAVKKVEPTRSNIGRLALEFENINEPEYALKVYEKGRSEGKDGYEYTFEIAKCQGNLGNYQQMTDTYLDLVVQEPAYLQTVQNSLNRTLNLQENEENQTMLKNKLLKRTQQSPEESMYSELLIWYFMQKKDFASAFVQASGLDKRLSENGYRIVNLASLAHNNKDYDTALRAYQYIIDKGPAGDYYITAKIERLQVMKEQLEERPGINTEAYKELEAAYEASLNQVGKKYETAIMMKELAHVQAFYLDKSEAAIVLLREATNLPGLDTKTQAVCKLELGDILLFRNEVWDASLLFSQVELDFKEDILGSEAKFRNARISYFTGDFEWAQGQLDVLKASTTKLISNDAIDLSLLITDNFNMDTTVVPMQQYARADLLSYQNNFELANTTLDSIADAFPMHTLADEIKMMKAGMCMKQAKYEEAKTLYQSVLDFHFTDITADDALYKLADMQQFIFNDNAKAMELFEKLIIEFPGSLYVVDARKRFRELRGDAIN
ncbi:MAG: tetratricopeptide repeat protein [Flavobacteriales bacterium]